MKIKEMTINDIANEIANYEDKLYNLSSYDNSGHMSNDEYYREESRINEKLVYYQGEYIRRLENKLDGIKSYINK